MTVEELMLPRIKVSEEGYPDMPFSSGQIITLANYDKSTNQYFYLAPNQNKFYDAWFERYPAIFRKLAWYEERDVSELSQYVKVRSEIISGTWASNKVFNVSGHAGIIFADQCDILPATETEYLTYNKSR